MDCGESRRMGKMGQIFPWGGLCPGPRAANESVPVVRSGHPWNGERRQAAGIFWEGGGKSGGGPAPRFVVERRCGEQRRFRPKAAERSPREWWGDREKGEVPLGENEGDRWSRGGGKRSASGGARGTDGTTGRGRRSPRDGENLGECVGKRGRRERSPSPGDAIWTLPPAAAGVRRWAGAQPSR